MQNLRDQLLKAGLVNPKQKRQVEQEKRRARKQQPQGQVEAERQRAYEARLEARRAADRQRAAAQRAAQAEKEKRLQIRHIVDYWQLPEEPGGTRRWHFMTRQNTIKSLHVSEALAERLRRGDVAIVERPDDGEPAYVLVEREAAALIGRLDPQYVRFANDRPASEDDA